jgi:hypothetical protein
MGVITIAPALIAASDHLLFRGDDATETSALIRFAADPRA